MSGGKPDLSNVGVDRPTQNPQDAVEAEGGKYSDSVESMSTDEKLGTNVWPQAPGPNPIRGAK